MTRLTPVWRSLLYVPAHVERFVDRAHTRGADGILLDLEDSVPASEKAAARAGVAAAAARVRRGPNDVLVRINAPLSLAVPDIEAAIGPDVDGLVVTKARGPELMTGIALGRLGTPRDVAGLVAFLATVEPNFITGQDFIIDGFQFKV